MRRNPLFKGETYLTPDRSISADNLHLLSLGVSLYWISCVLNLVILLDVFGTRATTKVAKEQASLAILKASMSSWQAAERRAGRERTVPNNFTAGMLGAPQGAVSLQGAESNAVVAFLVGSELPRLYREGKLADARWRPVLICGDNLQKMLQGLHDHKGKVPETAQQEFVDAWVIFSRSAREAGLPFVPKCHFVGHLCAQLGFLGASAAQATWRDEQANGELKERTPYAQPRNWHARLLSEWRRLPQRRS